MDHALSRPSGVSRVAAAGIVLAAGSLVAGATFFGGASGDASVVWVGGAAVLLVAVALVAACFGLLPLPVLDRPAWLTVGGLTGLVLWTGVSIAWSVAGDLSWSALNKGIAYLGFVVVGIVFATLGTNTTRAAASLLAAVLGSALVWALAGKAIPALAANDAVRVARLHSPIGYWNALALLADASLALGAWLAVAAWGRRSGVRALGGALVYFAVLAGLLTASRAGVIAGVLVVGLWLWLGPRRVESAAALAVAAIPAAAVAGWAFTRHALVDTGQSHSTRVHDGAILGVLGLVALGVAVAGVVWGVPPLVRSRERLVARVLGVGAAIAVVAVAAVGISKGTHAFSQTECTNTASRFGCTNTNRLHWWREAGDVFRANPLGGSGAGTFQVARRRYRTSGDTVTEPHSVPLQVLAGTGLVGALLLVVFVGGAGATVARRVTALETPERPAAVAVAALPVAYAIHALVDYDVDFVAVTAPALFALGALLGAGRRLVRLRQGAAPALAVLGVTVAAVASLALPWLADRRIDGSYSASDAGDANRAVADARSARSLNPLSPEPLYALASAFVTAGDLDGARGAYEHATRLQPENPDTWFRLGLFEFIDARDMCAAYQALNHSYTLDPRSTHWTPGSELEQARASVNDPVNPACGR
jgi:hypothetical protein